ncbi:MAG: YjjG family noncanonical pyrimidine nucleotidase [Candidatus Limivicinus sp.]|nr:YjjG family noncanonical pyrimidine nucleotidase [Clostridiales bacterium]MDY3859143.1 YjjG family noncanonical pyrimidine nucleotidase [Candidatus Limivicinus sp.]
MTDTNYTGLPTVLIDLDNTILNFDIAERTALSAAFSHYGLEPTDEILSLYSSINRRYWEMLELGEISREALLVGRFVELFERIGCSAPAIDVESFYENRLASGHWFMPGAEELLEAMNGKYRLFMCSNGNARVQDGRIASSGIGHYFEDIFISERIGFDKPDPRYFKACFDRIPGFDRSRCIMVGDSLSSDIRGGINAGVLTCWYNPAALPRNTEIIPDYEISSLDQLLLLLRKIFC